MSRRSSDDTWGIPSVWEAHSMGVNAVSWAPITDYEDLS